MVPAAVLAFVGVGCCCSLRLGQEFVPTLDEKDIAMHAMRIPSTSLTQSHGDADRTSSGRSRRFPEVAFVFSKTGTAEVAADPMPPNVSDTFIILKPQDEWRSEAELDELIEHARRKSQVIAAHAEDEHGKTRTRR